MLDRDPASVYKRLRREMPIVKIQAINRIVLTKAEDVYRAKTDTDYFGSLIRQRLCSAHLAGTL